MDFDLPCRIPLAAKVQTAPSALVDETCSTPITGRFTDVRCKHFLLSNLHAVKQGGYDTRLPAVLQSGGTHPSMLSMSETTYRHFDIQEILLSIGHAASSKPNVKDNVALPKWSAFYAEASNVSGAAGVLVLKLQDSSHSPTTGASLH